MRIRNNKVIEYLIKVKNRFHYLGYFEDERAIETKIEFLKLQIVH